MTTGFAFPSTQPTFGTSGGSFFTASTGTGTSGIGSLFATPPNTTTFGLGSNNQTNTSGGLTLGSAGTLFSTASFPSTTSTPSLFSGLGSTATTKPTFGLGLSSSTATTSAPAFGFASAIPAATTTAPSLSNFGFNLGSNLFSASSATTTPFTNFSTNLSTGQPFGLGLTSSAMTTTTASVGLGGVDFSQAASGDTGSTNIAGKTDNKAVKELPVPNEILIGIDSLKKHVKEQKNIREEITRISSKPLFKVQEETDSLKNLLNVVDNGIQKNVSIIEKLKQETAQELKNAEIAQRTKDIPPGLQYENTAPTEYFQKMVTVFENRMQLYRQKIEQMERHLLALSQSTVLTPQELTLAMKRIHETFVALAAQLQILHESVKAQKEQYLNYRKIFHGDMTNIFESKSGHGIIDSTPSGTKFNVGPTPFSGIANATAAAMASTLNRMQQPTAGPPPTLGFSSGNLGGGLFSSSNLAIGNTFGSPLTGLSGSNLSLSSANVTAIKPIGK